MKSTLINFILFIVAIIIFIPLTAVNITVVLCVYNINIFKTIGGYFYSSAINIDRFANSEFRTLWNLIMISKLAKKTGDYHKFGKIDETISYVLGKNKMNKSLSKCGYILCAILNFFDKNHVEKTVLLEDAKKFESRVKSLV